MKTPFCSSCRRGENSEPAEFQVRGLLNNRPYRANLCSEHLADLEMNLGLEVRSCRRVETGPSALQLESVYRHLCATVVLDAAGLAKLDAARDRWLASLFGKAA